jgi:GT2 family glycosyltransferase
MQEHQKVSMIILNWNGWKDTIECLESLYQITYPNYDVILVDNGSKDDSLEKTKEYCEGRINVESKFFEHEPSNKPIKITEYTREEAEAGGVKEEGLVDLPSNRKLILIKNEKNYGFAEGNNIGIRYAFNALDPDYILLLNNDTIVDPRFLAGLVKVAEDNEEIGMVATKLLFYDSPNIINSVGTLIFKDGSAAHLGGREIDIDRYNQVVETFAPCAAAALYRSDMLNEIGLFDPDFFAYLEDVDLGWRARLAGWKCIFVPKAVVYHKHSASSKKYSVFKLFYIERNRIWLMIKNYPLCCIFLSPVYTIYRFILMLKASKNKNTEVSKYSESIPFRKLVLTLLKAWLYAFIKLPKFINKRKMIRFSKKKTNKQIAKWFIVFSKPISRVVRRGVEIEKKGNN